MTDDKASPDELKALHKTIKKVSYDIEQFSFNTSISAFMICVNELMALKCNKKEILRDLLVLLAPFAPHICEELWEAIGEKQTICDANWPCYNEEYLKESTISYSISFNGKTRFTMDFLLMQILKISKLRSYPMSDQHAGLMENHS